MSIFLTSWIYLAATHASAAETVLVQSNAGWKYLDNGSNQGVAWRSAEFDDGAWAAGPAKLGYGDGDEATVVNCGPTAPLCTTNNFITTYFRHSFTPADSNAFRSLRMRLVRDDGAVVYLNGTEIRRDNMPTGAITHAIRAEAQLRAPAEGTFLDSLQSPSLLVNGVNILAVEVHQRRNNSADMSFALELLGSDQLAVTRAPYLQMATPTNVVLRWRTSVATDSRVRYGTDRDNLDLTATDSTETTEHEVTLSGLVPSARYYYSVGTTTEVLAGDLGCSFVTPPPPGTRQPIRVWAIGDGGTANASAAAVRDAYLNFTGSQSTDLLLMLGDNAYDNGTDSEFQRAVFDMHAPTLEQTALWPTIGNHDTAGLTNPPPNIPYFDIFSLPTNGEAGGMPSGTERYYSFEYGNVHFICLDSTTSSRAPGDSMLTWLQNDLACTATDWIIAYWHHPPYSKGHNSDLGLEHTQIRENALPILEAGGVDLVLNGDSHAYERSYLLSGHYGLSSSLTQAMKLNAGSGREDDTGVYHKPIGLAANRGTVYIVAGCGGSTVQPPPLHPAMYTSLSGPGSVVLDINDNRLDAKFITNKGATNDYFTILKDITNSPPAVSIVTPAQGQTFAQLVDIAVEADAVDPDGAINQVDFYADSTLIGTATNSPFRAIWPGVPAGTHEVLAVATDDLGATISSPPVNFTVTPPLLPPAPSDLSATPVSTNQIDLSWSLDSANADGFRIERSSGGSSFAEMATVAAGVTSYSDSGLLPLTTYTYRVLAFNEEGSSPYSDPAAAKTLGPPPASPILDFARTLSSSSIKIVWQDKSTDETSFRIEISSDGTNFTSLAAVNANTKSYISTNLVEVTAYHFRVLAHNDNGDSLPSSIASAITFASIPAVPSLFRANAVSSNRIDLRWLDNSDNEEYFKIDRKTDGLFSRIATVPANTTNFIDATCKPNVAYTYRIRSVNAGGNSPRVGGAKATTFPSQPSMPDLEASDDTGASDSDDITSKDALTFSGAADANVTVKLFSDGVEVGSGSVSNGAYHIFTSPLGEGTHQITTRVLNSAGKLSTESDARNVAIDIAPPTIVASRTPEANENGWNKTDVTASYQAGDGLELDSPSTGAFTFSAEGTGQSHTFTVEDTAGNSASGTISGINIDKTPPAIHVSRSIEPNANGWNNADVTASFSATDSGSGLASAASGSVDFTAEGANQSHAFPVEDLAGNQASAAISGVNIDKTPPTITASVDPAPNANGWNNSNVTGSYNANDSGSGLDSPATGAFEFTDEGATQSHTFTVQDLAGNSANATVSGVNIDKIPPTITASVDPAPNANGWNNSDVTASYAASDAESGLSSPTNGSFIFNSEGAGQSHAFTVHDQADNSASAAISNVNIDKTAPPAATISSGPSDPSSSTSATFDFTDTEGGVTLLGQLDGAGFGIITSPKDYSGLAEGGHIFQVKARDLADNESGVTSYAWSIALAPPVPTGFTATPANGQVALSWNASAGAIAYNVKRSTASGGSYTTIAAGVAGTSHTDATPANGTTYYYVVSALDGASESGNSLQASATPQAPPTAPRTLGGTGISPTQINLTWQDRSNNESGFRIERSLKNQPFVEIAVVGVNVQSFSDTGLARKTDYYYRVRAFNIGGNSAYSNTAKVSTRP